MLSLWDCLLKVAAKKPFAPGLPVKGRTRRIPTVRRPRTWVFGDQKHKAERAGLHDDFRLSDGRTAFSWALRKGIPPPGKRHLAIRQSDHSPGYIHFEGPIKSRYGRGKVSLDRGGHARVLRAGPDEIRFALLDKKNPQEMLLTRAPKYGDDKWLLHNVTPTKKTRPDIPMSKPSYRAGKAGDLGRYLSDRYVLSSKIDGAQVTATFNGKAEVYSHRPSSASGELLNHAYILGAENVKPPKSLHGTQVRAEVFGIKDGKVIHMKDLGGIMNSSPEKALEKMKRDGIRLYAAPFSVIRHKGKSMEGSPYLDHLKVLKKAVSRLPENWIMPDVAVTSAEKKRMIKTIQKGKHPLTREGFVAHLVGEHASTPEKVKFKDHKQVYITEVFPMRMAGKTVKMAGGFTYSLTPKGKTVGRVGTGLSMRLRKEMWENRSQLKGRKVVIESTEQFPSGAYRAPSFVSFHM